MKCYPSLLVQICVAFFASTPLVATPQIEGLYPVKVQSFKESTDDLKFLEKLLQGVDIVGLGESVHASGGFYDMKFRVIRFLVEKMGFRAVAFELGWSEANVLKAYVDNPQLPLDAVKNVFKAHPTFNDGEFVAFLNWLRERNQNHSDVKEKVYIFGTDVQFQSREFYNVIEYYVKQVRRAHPDLIPLVDDLQKNCLGIYNLHWEYDACNRQTDLKFPNQLDQYNSACLSATQHLQSMNLKDFPDSGVFAKGLFASHEFLYHCAKDQDVQGENGYLARDLGSKDLFEHIFENINHSRKTVVWYHNAHIAYTAQYFFGHETPKKMLGGLLREKYKSRYFPIGLFAYKTEINWPETKEPPISPTPSEDSLEALLHKQAFPAFMLDLKHNALLPPGKKIKNYLIAGGDFVSKNPETRLNDDFAAILFLQESRPTKRLP